MYEPGIKIKVDLKTESQKSFKYNVYKYIRPNQVL